MLTQGVLTAQAMNARGELYNTCEIYKRAALLATMYYIYFVQSNIV